MYVAGLPQACLARRAWPGIRAAAVARSKSIKQHSCFKELCSSNATAPAHHLHLVHLCVHFLPACMHASVLPCVHAPMRACSRVCPCPCMLPHMLPVCVCAPALLCTEVSRLILKVYRYQCSSGFIHTMQHAPHAYKSARRRLAATVAAGIWACG